MLRLCPRFVKRAFANYWLRRLAHDDPCVRAAAMEHLGKMGQAAILAIPELVVLLTDENSTHREAAGNTLERIDPFWHQRPEATAAIPRLLERLAKVCMAEVPTWSGSGWGTRLEESNSEVREVAASVLGKMGTNAAPAIPRLAILLKDHSNAVRKASADTLGKIGARAAPTIPTLLEQLADSDSEVRKASADALKVIDPNWHKGPEAVAAIPRLLQQLLDSQWQVREAAVDALGNIGAQAAPAIPNLVELFADSVPRVRKASAEVLKRIDPTWDKRPEAAAAIPQLLDRLADSDSEVRKASSDALKVIDPNWHKRPEAVAGIPRFLQRLTNSNSGVREAAAHALCEMGPSAASAVPELLERIPDENLDVATKAEIALDKIDPDWHKMMKAVAIVPRLLNRLPTRDSRVRGHVETVLRKIDPIWYRRPEAAAVIPRLLKVLEQPAQSTQTVKWQEAFKSTLDLIEPNWQQRAEVTSAIPQLVERLRDVWHIQRADAARSLGIMESAATAAIRQIVESLVAPAGWRETYQFNTVRESVEFALNRIDPKWRQRAETLAFIPRLIELLSAQSRHQCKSAEETLMLIGPSAIPQLTGRLSDRDPAVRMHVTHVLEKMGSHAAPAVLELVGRLSDGYYGVRLHAADALGSIGPQAHSAIPQLIERLSANVDSMERYKLQKALEYIDPSWHKRPEALAVVPRLIDRLQAIVGVKDTVKDRLMATSRFLNELERSQNHPLHSGIVSVLSRIDSNWRSRV